MSPAELAAYHGDKKKRRFMLMLTDAENDEVERIFRHRRLSTAHDAAEYIFRLGLAALPADDIAFWGPKE